MGTFVKEVHTAQELAKVLLDNDEAISHVYATFDGGVSETCALRECARLACALACNTSVSLLALSNFPPDYLAVVSEATRFNTSLRSLSILLAYGSDDESQLQIQDDICIEMADIIKDNTNLQSFSLTVTDAIVGDAAGVAIAEAVERNTTLKSFEFVAMSNNRESWLGDTTGMAMAKVISNNSILQSFFVDFSNCEHIGSQTGIAMADAIIQNRHLRYLGINLDITGVRDEACADMADAIRQHSMLQSAFISVGHLGQGFSNTGLAVARIINENHALRSFEFLLGMPIGDGAELAITEAIRQNTSLEYIYGFVCMRESITNQRIQLTIRDQMGREQLRQELIQLAASSDSIVLSCLRLTFNVIYPQHYLTFFVRTVGQY